MPGSFVATLAAQAGGGLETYQVTRAATKQRAAAMQAGAGIGGVCSGQTR